MTTQYQIQYFSGPYKVQYFKEAVSQSFKVGDMVVVTTDTGYIRISATGDAVSTGIALKDATGTTAYEIPVMIIESGTFLMSSVYHATAASAITAVTQIGASYDPRYSTGANYLDIGTQTDNIFTGQKHMADDAIGTQYGRIIFTIKPTALTGCGAVLAS
jgi:hypothetical protein